MTTAIQAQGVFHLEYLSQRHVSGTDNLLPHQMGSQGATFSQILCRTAEQGIAVRVPLTDGTPGARQSRDVQQLIDLRSTRQPLRIRQLPDGFLLQRLEQAVELHRALFLPVQLQQPLDQLFLLFIQQETVGQVQIQRVAPVDV